MRYSSISNRTVVVEFRPISSDTSTRVFTFKGKHFEEVINVEEKQGTVVIRGERERGNFCLEFQARVVLAPGNIAPFVRHCPPALSGHLARLSLMASLHSLLPLSHWPLDFL